MVPGVSPNGYMNKIQVQQEVTNREKVVAACLMYGGAVGAGGGYLLLGIAMTGCRGSHVAGLLGVLASVGGNVMQALGQYACRVNAYRTNPQAEQVRWWPQWVRQQVAGVMVALLLLMANVGVNALRELYMELSGR